MATIRVLDENSWKTVEAPYIMHGGAWKTVFKVWVMESGDWKETHKTAYTKFDLEDVSGGGNIQVDGNWTVPANTRYIRVRIWGHSGSGGGAQRTGTFNGSSYGYSTAHYVANSGGPGGHGGYAEAILEVDPGVQFTWTGFEGSSTAYQTGGRGSASLLSAGITRTADTHTSGMYYVNPPEHTTASEWAVHTSSNGLSDFWAEEGNSAPNIVFTGVSPTSGAPYVLTAGGGGKGYGGHAWVMQSSSSAAFFPSGYYTYYDMSRASDGATGHQWAADNYPSIYDVHTEFGYMDQGEATLTGNASSFASSTLTKGGGMSSGGSASSTAGADGPAGSKGKIIIETYQGL